MWALIEAEDTNTGNLLTHIVPVVPFDGFETKAEADEFLEKLDAAGSPCITNENDEVTATYFGHTLTSDCQCGAKPMESDPGCYCHKELQ